MKLSPHQERLCKLRCEQRLSEQEIARLLGVKHGSVRNSFIEIRRLLRIETFDEAWTKYKKIKSSLEL